MTAVERIRRAAARREPLRASGETTAFRLVHGEADGLPHVAIDWFDGVAVVSLYAEVGEAGEAELVGALLEAARPRSVYLKRRPREARVDATTRKGELAPERPAHGEPVDGIAVRENGLAYLIRPAQGLSVGLYLDMRDTRAWLRGAARGTTVLNCFAYTCGFGVSALAGGATRVVNVDLSKRVLAWGQENAALNGQAPNPRDYVAADVMDWLGRLRKKGETFDRVVLDPPSFSTANRKAFSAARDYPKLMEAAARVTAPGGQLVACCNLAQLSPAKFRALADAGLTAAGRSGSAQAKGPSPIDFPSTPAAPASLKVLVYDLR